MGPQPGPVDMERGKVVDKLVGKVVEKVADMDKVDKVVLWPVGLESIHEDCLLPDPAICSDISDDEARTEVMEQAEFDRLEAALDRSFGKARFEDKERENFFSETKIKSETQFPREIHEPVRISMGAGSLEGNTMTSMASPTKRVAGSKSKAKKSFTIEEGRQEIEKRLNEMRRTEIDQVCQKSLFCN